MKIVKIVCQDNIFITPFHKIPDFLMNRITDLPDTDPLKEKANEFLLFP